MVAAVRVHKHGGPEALTFDDVAVAAPGTGQVRIKNHACGINYIDTYFRSGLYPAAGGLPFIAGNEGAGEIVEVGAGVTEAKVGDRVGYVSALGSYTAERIMPKRARCSSRCARGRPCPCHPAGPGPASPLAGRSRASRGRQRAWGRRSGCSWWRPSYDLRCERGHQ